jgi:hypothetical protein
MFRRFFRIGFGGCGCALEEQFRDHAAELSYNLLNDFYLKKLKNWTNKLPSEPFDTFEVKKISDLIISSKEGKEGGNYAGKFFENLNKIIAELDSWKGSLVGAKDTVMSYEGAIIDVLIQNVTKMKDEAKSIEKRGSVLLESLPVDSFTETLAKGESERFYIYNQNITETRELIVDQFGQMILESQGFNHQPELQMLPFSIKEVRDEVFKNITDTIETRRLKDSATGGYLFFVGLGGGTGTGVISPLAEKFGKGSLGYFTVTVLGGREDDKKLASQQGWFRRCFNMLIALNDLIVTAKLDGIILVDNDVIMTPGEKEGKSGPDLMAEIDKKIIEKLYPAFGITVLDGNDLDWSQLKEPIGLHNLKQPPVIVPCYASGFCSKSEDNLGPLIEEALNNGKLAPCEDLEEAEKVFVYVRCITDEKKIRDALATAFKTVFKEVDKYEDIAILKDYLFCWDDVKNGNSEELKSSLRNVCEISWVDTAVLKRDQNEDKLELNNDSNENEKIIIEMRERELFNWDDVLEKNDGELKKYLEDCKIEVDSISISDDKKTITISNKKEVATITLIEGENKATLEWDNKGTKEKRYLKVKKTKEKEKKEKRKIYTPPEAELFMGTYVFNWDDVLEKNDGELKKYLEDCKIDFDSISPDEKTITISKNEKEVATITLKEGGNKATLEWDNNKGNKEKCELKVKDRGIYDYFYLRKNGNTKVEDPELKVETAKGKCHVYLKKCQTTRTWITNNLKKRIIVFESQEIGSFWHVDEKTNEVLILLFNPNVKEALKDRLLEAKNFVDLLDAFKDEIEKQAKEGESSEDKPIIAEKINFEESKKLSEIVNKFSEATKGITKEDNKLKPQAIDFLFPKELYDKNKGIYEVMVKILDRLKEEVLSIPDEDKDGDWWPIFQNEIFNIISTSVKRDEVLLSAIEALEDQNKFNRLVGEGVYDTYFETFKRQYFKYKTRYLYRPGVGEPILSDAAERELPEALKEELDKEEERITGEDLRNLMKKYTRVMDGHTGTTDGTKLSYPAMLAVAGLYAEWEQVGSWNYDETKNGFVLAENKDKIIEKLFKKENPPRPDDFEDYVFSKESQGIIIPDKRNLLIIETEEEDATLVIREADKDLLTELTKEDVPSTNEIPKELVERFKGVGSELVNNDNYSVKDRKLLQPRPEAITKKKLYCCYYIKENAGKYNIDGDKINNNLKVKKEEGEDGKTLKIYQKRRGEREV